MNILLLETIPDSTIGPPRHKTKDELIRIGIDACIERLDRSFVQKHADSSTGAYGDVEEGVRCFVGVSDEKRDVWERPGIVLDSTGKFPYRVSCTVDCQGVVVFGECVLPVRDEQTNSWHNTENAVK